MLETASLATGIAAAVLEDADPETSGKLGIASAVLGLGGLISGIGAAKLGRNLVGAFKRTNVISGTLDSIEFMGKKRREIKLFILGQL
ncbi:hypothetical protein BC1_00025 [Bacillus phage BC-1]|nr:hypothetical protein BC1_00025 [Bacillus phage BC-1]